MDCVVLDDDPAEGFDAHAECDDKVDDMTWVAGAHGVTWSGS